MSGAGLCTGLPREEGSGPPGDTAEGFGPTRGGEAVQGVAPALPQSCGARGQAAGRAKPAQPGR